MSRRIIAAAAVAVAALTGVAWGAAASASAAVTHAAPASYGQDSQPGTHYNG